MDFIHIWYHCYVLWMPDECYIQFGFVPKLGEVMMNFMIMILVCLHTFLRDVCMMMHIEYSLSLCQNGYLYKWQMLCEPLEIVLATVSGLTILCINLVVQLCTLSSNTHCKVF